MPHPIAQGAVLFFLALHLAGSPLQSDPQPKLAAPENFLSSLALHWGETLATHPHLGSFSALVANDLGKLGKETSLALYHLHQADIFKDQRKQAESQLEEAQKEKNVVLAKELQEEIQLVSSKERDALKKAYDNLKASPFFQENGASNFYQGMKAKLTQSRSDFAYRMADGIAVEVLPLDKDSYITRLLSSQKVPFAKENPSQALINSLIKKDIKSLGETLTQVTSNSLELKAVPPTPPVAHDRTLPRETSTTARETH